MKTNGRRRILRSVVTAGGRRCRFGRFLRATIFSSVRWVRAAIKPIIRFKKCFTFYESNLKIVSFSPKISTKPIKRVDDTTYAQSCLTGSKRGAIATGGKISDLITGRYDDSYDFYCHKLIVF